MLHSDRNRGCALPESQAQRFWWRFAIMAFQNGFFWKQILDGLHPILKAHGVP